MAGTTISPAVALRLPTAGHLEQRLFPFSHIAALRLFDHVIRQTGLHHLAFNITYSLRELAIEHAINTVNIRLTHRV